MKTIFMSFSPTKVLFVIQMLNVKHIYSLPKDLELSLWFKSSELDRGDELESGWLHHVQSMHHKQREEGKNISEK